MGLKERWGVKNNGQFALILLVFILTGSTVVYLKKDLKALTGLDTFEPKWLGTVIYFIAVLPVYQLLLLVYATLLGQFRFFWERERNMIRRILGKK